MIRYLKPYTLTISIVSLITLYFVVLSQRFKVTRLLIKVVANCILLFLIFSYLRLRRSPLNILNLTSHMLNIFIQWEVHKFFILFLLNITLIHRNPLSFQLLSRFMKLKIIVFCLNSTLLYRTKWSSRRIPELLIDILIFSSFYLFFFIPYLMNLLFKIV